MKWHCNSMNETPDKLLVLDILRSSMNDGPGIRTTVFLKGCPLKCAWCHNPESQSGRRELSFAADKCTRCRRCGEVCPAEVHAFEVEDHTMHRGRCELCTSCVDACPSEAIKLVGEHLTPGAVVEMVLRDKHYFERSGGGITLSGGEPMAQFMPVKRTLELAKAAGLHTCLDTCGHASLEHYMEIKPFVDLFLWDYKATGEDLHRRLTAVDGKLIRSNLSAL